MCTPGSRGERPFNSFTSVLSCKLKQSSLLSCRKKQEATISQLPYQMPLICHVTGRQRGVVTERTCGAPGDELQASAASDKVTRTAGSNTTGTIITKMYYL